MINSKKHRHISSIVNLAKENSSLLTLLITILVAAILSRGVIIRFSNIQAILSRASIVGVVAVGQAFVILTGEIDLSTGALFGFAIGIVSVLSRIGFGIEYAAILGITIVGMVGFINGIIVAKTKIPSFIVTLATMTIVETASLAFIGAHEMLFKSLQEIIRNFFYFIPRITGLFSIIMWIFIAVIAQLILSFSRFGLNVYAIGGKEIAAIYSGVPRTRVKILVFTLSGVCSGIAGLLLANKLGSGTLSIGGKYLLIPIAAVILGGASLFGGEGNMIGTAIGAAVISITTNLMNLLQVDQYLQQSILAIAVLVFMYFNQSFKKYLFIFNRSK